MAIRPEHARPNFVAAGHRHHGRPALRGLIFEMGNVLYDVTSWRRWLLRLVARLGMHVDPQQFYESWDRQFLVDVYCGRREYGEAFRSFLLSAGLTWGQIDEVEAASCVRQQELEADDRPFPGAASVLAKLASAGLALGVLADSPHSSQQLQEKLRRLGLGGRFGAVISSLDLASAKPSADCYEAALCALHLSASQAAFIGCREDDLTGAARAGLTTIAFNCGSPAPADFHVGRLADLVPIVESWWRPSVVC